MGRQKRKVKPLADVWEVTTTNCGKIIQPILTELDPPSWTGARSHQQVSGLMASSFRCAAAASGTGRPRIFPTTVPFIARFSDGRQAVARAIWAALIEDCEELGGMDLRWQSPIPR